MTATTVAAPEVNTKATFLQAGWQVWHEGRWRTVRSTQPDPRAAGPHWVYVRVDEHAGIRPDGQPRYREFHVAADLLVAARQPEAGQ